MTEKELWASAIGWEDVRGWSIRYMFRLELSDEDTWGEWTTFGFYE